LSFVALLRAKVSNPKLHRKIALEGHRFTPSEALEAGFVDYLVEGNTAAVLAKAEEVAESASSLAKMGVWGEIKSVLHHHSLDLLARKMNVNGGASKSRL